MRENWNAMKYNWHSMSSNARWVLKAVFLMGFCVGGLITVTLVTGLLFWR